MYLGTYGHGDGVEGTGGEHAIAVSSVLSLCKLLHDCPGFCAAAVVVESDDNV